MKNHVQCKQADNTANDTAKQSLSGKINRLRRAIIDTPKTIDAPCVPSRFAIFHLNAMNRAIFRTFSAMNAL